VLSLEVLDAQQQRIGDLELVIFSIVVVSGLGLVKRSFQLADQPDQLARLFGKFVFLTAEVRQSCCDSLGLWTWHDILCDCLELIVKRF